MSEALTETIVKAAEAGNYEAVQSALDAGASPDAMGPNSSALHIACFNGHENVVQLLLRNRANPNLVDRQGFTPLHLAASKGRDACIQHLVQFGALLDAQTEHGGSALHVAAASDFPATVQLLMDAGSNKELRDTGGNTPLLTACGTGRAKVAQVLIKGGAKTKVMSDGDETLLHKLARGIRGLRIAKWHTSGEVNGKSRSYSIVNGYFTMTKEAQTKVLSLKDQKECAKLNWGPKAHLAYLEACDFFGELLKMGININTFDSGDNSALNLICHAGEGRLVKQLLKADAKWKTQNSVGATPLHMAAGSGRPDGLEAYIKGIPKAEVEAQINAPDQFGWTPLHYLADIGGDFSMAALLLDQGADKNAASTGIRGGDMPVGLRPFEVAKHWKDSEMAALLMP